MCKIGIMLGAAGENLSSAILFMNSNKSEDVLGQNAAIFFVICVVYLLGVSLIGIKRIKRNN